MNGVEVWQKVDAAGVLTEVSATLPAAEIDRVMTDEIFSEGTVRYDEAVRTQSFVDHVGIGSGEQGQSR